MALVNLVAHQKHWRMRHMRYLIDQVSTLIIHQMLYLLHTTGSKYVYPDAPCYWWNQIIFVICIRDNNPYLIPFYITCTKHAELLSSSLRHPWVIIPYKSNSVYRRRSWLWGRGNGILLFPVCEAEPHNSIYHTRLQNLTPYFIWGM